MPAYISVGLASKKRSPSDSPVKELTFMSSRMVIASSPTDAYEIAKEKFAEAAPENDGWEKHQITLVEIPKESLIIATRDARTQKEIDRPELRLVQW